MSEKNKPISNLLFLLSYLWKMDKPTCFIKGVQVLFSSVSPILTSVFLKLLVDEMTIRKDPQKIILYIFSLVVSLLIINMSLSILSTFLSRRIDITRKNFTYLIGDMAVKMKYSDLEQPWVKDLLNMAKDSSDFISLIDNLTVLISNAISIIGLVVIILSVNYILIFALLGVALVQLLADKSSSRLWTKWRDKYAPIMRQGQYLERVMKSVQFGKEVRVNYLQKWIYQKYNKNIDDYVSVSYGHNKAIRRLRFFMEVILLLFIGGFLILLTSMIVKGSISIGNAAMYITAVLSLTTCVQAFTNAVSEIIKCEVFTRDFRKCVALMKSCDVMEGESDFPKSKAGVEIEFCNVSFRYPGTEREILKNFSLTIKANEKLSIVGLNGAGKTTIVKLLCRFYQPDRGCIKVNGIDIQTIPYNDYMKHFGVVFQNYKVFSFTVKENVSMSQEPDEVNLYESLRDSGLQEKIEQLQEGVETYVNKEFEEEGQEFSGGEAQKLALARALYKKAPVIILDEPTAALDPMAEYEMYKGFEKLVHHKTAVYISHRLSSTRFTDRIIVIQDGIIAEEGTHDDLMNLEDGIYANMFKTQAEHYTKEAVGSNA